MHLELPPSGPKYFIARDAGPLKAVLTKTRDGTGRDGTGRLLKRGTGRDGIYNNSYVLRMP